MDFAISTLAGKLVISAVRLWHVKILEITCTVWRRFGRVLSLVIAVMRALYQRDYVRYTYMCEAGGQPPKPQPLTCLYAIGKISTSDHLINSLMGFILASIYCLAMVARGESGHVSTRIGRVVHGRNPQFPAFLSS